MWDNKFVGVYYSNNGKWIHSHTNPLFHADCPPVYSLSTVTKGCFCSSVSTFPAGGWRPLKRLLDRSMCLTVLCVCKCTREDTHSSGTPYCGCHWPCCSDGSWAGCCCSQGLRHGLLPDTIAVDAYNFHSLAAGVCGARWGDSQNVTHSSVPFNQAGDFTLCSWEGAFSPEAPWSPSHPQPRQPEPDSWGPLPELT